MLARGLLCRLAAEAPKTSTHDLPQLARLLQRSLSARNASSIRSIGALSRGLRASVAISRRSYATTVRATKPTATVKKAVKKQAAKKPAPKKKAATKTAAKKPAAKKAAPKKKKAAPKPKPKRTKKVLTQEEKDKATITQLKKIALKEPFTHRSLTTYNVFLAETLKGVKDPNGVIKNNGSLFKALSTAEREHYNHIAGERNAARKAEYDAWVRSYTPEQIRQANNARARLRRLYVGKFKGSVANTKKIQDDRQIKVLHPFALFLQERWASGDMEGIKSTEASKLIAEEWKALSTGEKQKYTDAHAADKATKIAEYAAAYGEKA